MNNLNRLACVAVVGLLMPPGVGAGDLAHDDSAITLLASLKAKDNKFENAVLRYTKWSDWLLKDTSWRDPPGWAEQHGIKDLGPRVIKLHYHEQMVVRGHDTTFISEADPDMKKQNRTTWVSPYHKWGETGGVFREISDIEGSGGIDFIFETRKWGGPVGIVSEQRMTIEFVHGFGFGKRIKTIESVVREGNRRILKGTIQVWAEDISTFVIELGDDLVVKKAVIDCDVGGNLTRFEITTEGAIERQGFVFARTGHLMRTAMGMKNARKMVPETNVTDEFSSRFVAVRFNLRDDVYKTLTRIEVTPGTLVRDYISNKVYQVEKDNTITDHGHAVAKGP
jgi:hypothetical protein